MRLVIAGLSCVLLGPLPGPAWAEEGPGTISTSATAHARLANTVADVEFGIESEGKSLRATQEALTQGSERLLGYLRGQNVERLRTRGASVSPQISYVQGKPQTILGYSGRVRVGFRVTAERLGAVLAGAMEHGGNTLESAVLRPTEAEVEAAQRGLAADAVRTALAQAGVVAEAAERGLGAVREIRIGRDDPVGSPVSPAPMMRMTAAAAAAPPIATEPGETEVSATVSIRVILIER